MSKLKVGVIACTVVLAGMVAAIAQAAPGDTLGVSTLVQRIFPEGNTDFKTLTTGPGENYTVRTGTTATDGHAGRGQGTAARPAVSRSPTSASSPTSSSPTKRARPGSSSSIPSAVLSPLPGVPARC